MLEVVVDVEVVEVEVVDVDVVEVEVVVVPGKVVVVVVVVVGGNEVEGSVGVLLAPLHPGTAGSTNGVPCKLPEVRPLL